MTITDQYIDQEKERLQKRVRDDYLVTVLKLKMSFICSEIRMRFFEDAVRRGFPMIQIRTIEIPVIATMINENHRYQHLSDFLTRRSIEPKI